MKRIKNNMVAFWNDTTGQDLVEYVLAARIGGGCRRGLHARPQRHRQQRVHEDRFDHQHQRPLARYRLFLFALVGGVFDLGGSVFRAGHGVLLL